MTVELPVKIAKSLYNEILYPSTKSCLRLNFFRIFEEKKTACYDCNLFLRNKTKKSPNEDQKL